MQNNNNGSNWDVATTVFLYLRRFGLYVDMMTLAALTRAGLIELERDGKDLLLITRFTDVLDLPVLNDVYV